MTRRRLGRRRLGRHRLDLTPYHPLTYALAYAMFKVSKFVQQIQLRRNMTHYTSIWSHLTGLCHWIAIYKHVVCLMTARINNVKRALFLAIVR